MKITKTQSKCNSCHKKVSHNITTIKFFIEIETNRIPQKRQILQCSWLCLIEPVLGRYYYLLLRWLMYVSRVKKRMRKREIKGWN